MRKLRDQHYYLEANYGKEMKKSSLKINPDLEDCIKNKFSDMIAKYRWSKSEEKFRKFMEDYFQAKNCTVKVKLVEY